MACGNKAETRDECGDDGERESHNERAEEKERYITSDAQLLCTSGGPRVCVYIYASSVTTYSYGSPAGIVGL